MNTFGLRFLATRSETEAHTGYIRNAKGGSGEYDHLIDRVFKHQAASYNATEFLKAKNATDLRSDRFLASYFYTNCYCNVTLRKGDEEGKSITTEDFINKVILAQENGSRNNLSYLLGDVGVGKTAFVNYLISRFGAEWVKSKNVWFVRIDVEVAGDGKKATPEKLVDLISKKILKIFKSNQELLINKTDAISELVSIELDKLSRISNCSDNIHALWAQTI